IAIFPQDAEQADQLIRIADERLYRQKHANHKKTLDGADRIETVPSADQAPGPAVSLESPGPFLRPISIETMRAPEKPESDLEAAARLALFKPIHRGFPRPACYPSTVNTTPFPW